MLIIAIFGALKLPNDKTFTIQNGMSKQLKCSYLQKDNGFTLIELLIGMVLASLVVVPLLTFMISIMDTDRKEQAKATSEQEIQAALKYIAQDLEQAVYIYDADGLMRDHSNTAATSGIRDQIPPIKPAANCNTATSCQPVIVFWKRQYNKNVVPLNSSDNNCSSSPSSCNDTFVYSLVGYYLIKKDNDTWSNTARIGRFEIQDGVRAPNPNGTLTLISPGAGTTNGPSHGFNLFNLGATGSSIKDKMNQWKKGSGNYNDPTTILVDYIDHSTVANGVAQVTCPPEMQAVPEYSNANVNNIFKTYSFYTCVDSSKTLAQVYLRGNALARIENGVMTYSDSKSTFFPKATIQVKGRGLLDAK